MFPSISSALLWRGLLAIVIGVVSVAWPGITVGALVVLFAAFAFFGLFSIVYGVQALVLSVTARRIGTAERRLASAV